MGLDEHADLGTFFLRIGVGIYFIWAGVAILLNPALANNLGLLLAQTPLVSFGTAAQAVMVVYTIYILLGALLILGLFTRAAGAAIAILSILTMAVVNWQLDASFAGSLGLILMAKDAVIIASGVSLFFTGARIIGVDCMMVE